MESSTVQQVKRSQHVLIVLGMHRSGTSLVARWLHSAGLSMGDQMVGASTGNSHGHYESQDIFRLHKSILNELHVDFRVGSSITHRIPPDFDERAKEIIAEKFSNYHQWGWKEPRTCLFIEKWLRLLPHAKILVVYRPCEQVVDSLLRRHEKMLEKRGAWLRKKLIYPVRKVIFRHQFTKTWINYNQHIIDTATKHSADQIMILSIDELINQSTKLAEYIKSIWGFNITINSIHELYNPKELRDERILDLTIPSKYNDSIAAIMDQLNELQRKTILNFS